MKIYVKSNGILKNIIISLWVLSLTWLEFLLSYLRKMSIFCTKQSCLPHDDEDLRVAINSVFNTGKALRKFSHVYKTKALIKKQKHSWAYPIWVCICVNSDFWLWFVIYWKVFFHKFVLANRESYRREGILKHGGRGRSNGERGAFGAYGNDGARRYRRNPAAEASAAFRSQDGHGANRGARYRGINGNREENGAYGFCAEETHSQEDGAGLDQHIFQEFEREQEVMKHLNVYQHMTCNISAIHNDYIFVFQILK